MFDSDPSFFKVDIENFVGPIDTLLDLAKAQKVNLEEISITKLADQFHDFITKEKDLNLEIASEYLLMATWLAYLKSKLLLPGTPDEEFKVNEVAEKLKLQLKKLELIRLLSEQMLKRKRLGREIRTRGSRSGIKPIYNSEYKLNLFELLKTYSTIIMTKDFQKINIPRLPVFTTEEGIKTIKDFFGNPTSSAIVLIALACGAYYVSELSSILLIFGAVCFIYSYTRKQILPFRLPQVAKVKDYNDLKPGIKTPNNSRGIAYFGNDMKSNEELWFANEDMRTHVLIFGSKLSTPELFKTINNFSFVDEKYELTTSSLKFIFFSAFSINSMVSITPSIIDLFFE